MIRFASILLLLYLFNSGVSQQNILILPLSPNHIEYGKKVRKLLKYHETGQDSLRELTLTSCTNALQKIFSDHKIEISDPNKINDSLVSIVPTDISRTTQGMKSPKKEIVEGHIEYYKKYYSLELNQLSREYLELQRKVSDYQWIVSVNLLEIYTQLPFSNKTRFAVHVNVYDPSLKLVYGNKFILYRKISKDMYYETLLHFINSAFEKAFEKINDLRK